MSTELAHRRRPGDSAPYGVAEALPAPACCCCGCCCRETARGTSLFDDDKKPLSDEGAVLLDAGPNISARSAAPKGTRARPLMCAPYPPRVPQSFGVRLRDAAPTTPALPLSVTAGDR